MKKALFVLIVTTLLVGCSEDRYVVTEGTYSSWNNGEMQLRKKTILVNTKTGETWGLAFDQSNKKYARDGYGWEQIPVMDK